MYDEHQHYLPPQNLKNAVSTSECILVKKQTGFTHSLKARVSNLDKFKTCGLELPKFPSQQVVKVGHPCPKAWFTELSFIVQNKVVSPSTLKHKP